MAVLGVALGAVQLLPLMELLPLNFREGSASLAQVREWLPKFDGVMLVRQAFREPYVLAELHRAVVAPQWPLPSREAIVGDYATYVERMLGEGHRLPLLLKPIHGLYTGLPGARSWRRYLSEQGIRTGAGAEVLRASLRVFQQAA